MALLQTKYVIVGYSSLFQAYGFYSASVFSTLAFGSISNNSSGTPTNQDLESVFSGEDVHLLYYHPGSSDLIFRASGTHSNAGFDSIDIDGNTFNRSDATHAQIPAAGGIPAGTTWTWDTSTNPFGTTTGVSKQVEWDDGQASTPTAPTNITFGSDPGTASASVSITATASGGSNGTMKVSENGTTWVANGSSFTFTRGTAKTIYARTEGSGSNSSNYTEAHTVGYRSPDLNVTVSRNPSGNIAHDYDGTMVVTISNGTATNTYRVLRTTNGNSGRGNTGNLTGTSGTVSLVSDPNATGNFPAPGGTYNYTIQGRIPTSQGGNNAWANTNATFSVTRNSTPQDTTPESFVDFTDATNQTRNVVVTSNVQTITTITGDVDVSVSGAGSPEFSVNGDTFSSTSRTINNNETISVRLTSANTYSTTRTATLTIGTKSQTFDVRTGDDPGSGGQDAGSGGSDDFNINILDTDGTTTVVSPGTRYVNVMNVPTSVTVPAKANNQNGTALVQQDMTGLTTSNSALTFLGFASGSLQLIVTRQTTGAISSQGFRLSNPSSTALTVTPIILRF